MAYSADNLNDIYDRTSGYCHLCYKTLAFTNYGRVGSRGAWEVEHSVARATGGTERRNNLYAACIKCNRSKGKGRTRSTRTKNGKARAPMCRSKRKEAKVANAIAGGVLGATAGALFGPAGIVIGALTGVHLGHIQNSDRS